MNDEAKYYNALNIVLQSEYPNYSELKKLYEQHGSWQKAWQSGRYKSHPDKELQKLDECGIRLLLQSDPDFPPLLREIPWPPFGIYIKGNLNLASSQDVNIAVVGTRKATRQGTDIAFKLGRELAGLGITVVSGLALGIDEAAHKGVVAAKATTVAVLAVGLERVYPAQNSNLAKEILECGGALVSEYPIGASSYPTRFVERNRIISGLSKGVVVIEAPEKSGALATAKFAVDQNRDVLVMPGPAGHANYAGSFALIRDGARLVNSTEDILEDLDIAKEAERKKKAKIVVELPEKERALYEILKDESEGLTVDKIAELANLDIQSVNRVLAFLVLRGIVKEDGGKYYLL